MYRYHNIEIIETKKDTKINIFTVRDSNYNQIQTDIATISLNDTELETLIQDLQNVKANRDRLKLINEIKTSLMNDLTVNLNFKKDDEEYKDLVEEIKTKENQLDDDCFEFHGLNIEQEKINTEFAKTDSVKDLYPEFYKKEEQSDEECNNNEKN